jgi:hypothetical protein
MWVLPAQIPATATHGRDYVREDRSQQRPQHVHHLLHDRGKAAPPTPAPPAPLHVHTCTHLSTYSLRWKSRVNQVFMPVLRQVDG